MEKLTISGEIVSLNEYINAERENKYIAAKIKREMTEMCQWYLKGMWKHMDKVKDKVHITFIWYCKNKKIDPDNTAWGKKFILDAMVKEGILKNDTWEFVEGFSDKFEIDSENPRIEVIMDDTENERQKKRLSNI